MSRDPDRTVNTMRDVHARLVVQAGHIDRLEVHNHPAREIGRHLVGTMPPRAGSFRTRTALLDPTTVGQTLVLCGLGGVGKSQSAAEYARALWDSGELDLLIWVDAKSRQAILSSYSAAAATVLGMGGADAEVSARQLLSWLAGTRLRWLVALDDLRLPSDLRGAWPPSTATGRVIVTTRRRDTALRGDRRQVLEVGTFTRAESVTYLSDRLPRHTSEGAELDALAHDLGHLPLALAQASAYIGDSPLLTVADYRDRFADRKHRLTDLLPDDEALPDDHSITVAATWSISVDLADDLTPKGVARPVLGHATMLDADGIPAAVFTAPAALTHLSGMVGRDVRADDVLAALGCLHRLSLITLDPESPDRAVRVHPLVQRATRERLDDDLVAALAWMTADSLVQTWPEVDGDDFSAVLRANAWALQAAADALLWRPEAHLVLFRLGMSIGEAGLAAEAVEYFERLRAEAVERFGADHPDSLAAHGSLAYWRADAGDLRGAYVELEDLLARRSATLDRGHPDLLDVRHQLANIKGEAGYAATAVAEFRELLADRTRTLGATHPDTLSTRAAIASWSGSAGDREGAVAEFESLVVAYAGFLGPTHRDTRTARTNLALWRSAAGDPVGALAEYEELLADAVRTVDPKHPDCLAIRHNLAECRGETGDATGAVAELRRLGEEAADVFGPDHPNTLVTLKSLATWLGEAGDPVEAVVRLQALLADCVRVLGPSHPLTREVRVSLAHWRSRTRTDPTIPA